MASVKIKADNCRDPRRKQKLLEVLSINEVYLVKIIETRDGYVTLTNTDQDLNKIFNGTTDMKLEQNNLFISCHRN